ncbi:hypothetical protein JW948_19220 [bacterium]|nr:hypothetical protein [bacterium]
MNHPDNGMRQPGLPVSVDPSLSIRLGIAEFSGLTIESPSTAAQALEAFAESVRQRYAGLHPGDIAGTAHARHLFRQTGIDPTKRRPSSESLLRRAIAGKSLFSVNTLVDVGNWCSLDFLLPVCVYDADRIRGPVQVHIGRPEDRYEALNGSMLNLGGRYCLADEAGAFGSPLTDSVRTAVGETTAHALFVLFAPASYPQDALEQHLQLSVKRILEFCGGEIVSQRISG